MASLADSSIRQYASPLKAWWEYCSQAKIDPHGANENDLLAFLTKKFEEGASYGTLNSARSAVSLISVNDVTASGVLARFFKGIFRLRPSKAKYEKTWSPDVVLRTLASHCAIEDSNLQKLSEKLVTLMALATAHRVQTLSLIKLSNIKRSKDGFEIRITDLVKTSRPGQYQPLLLISYFKDKPEICVASFLERYMALTAPLRNDCDTLFISSRRPFKAATAQTISRWIRAVLKLSGLGDEYTPHSTRHAATSTALAKGIDLSVIKSTAGWSQESQVFARFYNRPIESDRGRFAKAVFD